MALHRANRYGARPIGYCDGGFAGQTPDGDDSGAAETGIARQRAPEAVALAGPDRGRHRAFRASEGHRDRKRGGDRRSRTEYAPHRRGNGIGGDVAHRRARLRSPCKTMAGPATRGSHHRLRLSRLSSNPAPRTHTTADRTQNNLARTINGDSTKKMDERPE